MAGVPGLRHRAWHLPTFTKEAWWDHCAQPVGTWAGLLVSMVRGCGGDCMATELKMATSAQMSAAAGLGGGQGGAEGRDRGPGGRAQRHGRGRRVGSGWTASRCDLSGDNSRLAWGRGAACPLPVRADLQGSIAQPSSYLPLSRGAEGPGPPTCQASVAWPLPDALPARPALGLLLAPGDAWSQGPRTFWRPSPPAPGFALFPLSLGGQWWTSSR